MRVGGVWAERISAAVISLVMSGIMSAVMIGLNAGLGPEFLLAWPKGWLIGFCVSLPTARFLVPPIVRWQIAQTAGDEGISVNRGL